MGKGIAAWPSNTLLIPAAICHHFYTVSVCCPVGETLLTKTFADHNNTVNRVLGIPFLATLHIIFSCILESVWIALASNNTNHQRCWPGVQWVCQGNDTCFICSCQSDCLFLEVIQVHTQSDLNHRHTAGKTHGKWASLAVCQGFIEATRVGRWDEAV